MDQVIQQNAALIDGVESGKRPSAVGQLALGTCDAPPHVQAFEQGR